MLNAGKDPVLANGCNAVHLYGISYNRAVGIYAF